MKLKNISLLINKYGPGYVAEEKRTGKVVAHSKKLNVLFKKTKHRDDVVISWIPQKDTRYVFRISV